MNPDKQAAEGRLLAAQLPAPKVERVGGVNVIVQEIPNVTPDELVALAEHYKRKYSRA